MKHREQVMQFANILEKPSNSEDTFELLNREVVPLDNVLDENNQKITLNKDTISIVLNSDFRICEKSREPITIPVWNVHISNLINLN